MGVMKIRPRALVALVALATALALSAWWYLQHPADPIIEGRPASAWTADLLSSEYQVRQASQAALQKAAGSAVPQLRLLLRSREPWWGAFAQPLGPVLRPLLGGVENPLLRRQRATEMLALLGPKASGAIPDLIWCLRFPVSAPDAERALVLIGPASAEPLVRALARAEPATRESAARVLREFKPVSPVVLAGLVRATRDPAAPVRIEAVKSLGAAPATEELVAVVLAAAGDKVPGVRAASLGALGDLGSATPAAQAAALRGLSDLETIVELAAAKTLWKLTGRPDLVVPHLARILSTREGWQAAFVLGDLGAEAAGAVPALIEALQRERVARAFRTPPSSAFALGKIGPAAIPALGALLEAADPVLRLNAVMAFGFMEKRGAAAVPRLLPLLRDQNSEVRHAAAITLAGLGAEASQIVEGLSDCLLAEDIYMRSAAAAVLREIAPEGNWAVPAE